MDFQAIEALRERHPAWRLLRKDNASLVLSFLGAHFIDGNAGATSASALAGALDDHLDALNAASDPPRFPRSATDYLDEWAKPESGWLRRFYPVDSDEVHYDATSDLEKAFSWVSSLQSRTFVGTESRLHTVLNLLRQIVHGTETDQSARLEVLQQQRAVLDEQIRQVEAGNVDILTETAVRDRYQQLASTARELLTDFREVEENFRGLDRAARERIAGWAGSKGELLTQLVSDRTDISSSDQGQSFQAFYDFLLSEDRQDELDELLAKVEQLPLADRDHRLRTVHHDWSEAAERTQQTVRQISEQLRRFLDDQMWLENRRVLDLVREVEAAALTVRNDPPADGITLDIPGVPIQLPFERPLYDGRPATRVDSMTPPVDDEDIDVTTLLEQTFVDQARLADNIRSVVPGRSTALLSDIVQLYPIQEGVAEILGYLSLSDEDLTVTMDDEQESLIDYTDPTGTPRRARLPLVSVSRR